MGGQRLCFCGKVRRCSCKRGAHCGCMRARILEQFYKSPLTWGLTCICFLYQTTHAHTRVCVCVCLWVFKCACVLQSHILLLFLSPCLTHTHKHTYFFQFSYYLDYGFSICEHDLLISCSAFVILSSHSNICLCLDLLCFCSNSKLALRCILACTDAS